MSEYLFVDNGSGQLTFSLPEAVHDAVLFQMISAYQQALEYVFKDRNKYKIKIGQHELQDNQLVKLEEIEVQGQKFWKFKIVDAKN